MKSLSSWARLAAAIGLPAYLLFATVQRDVAFWDVGELQTVPYIFGVAHPTGFPVFIMLGWLFSHALPVGTVAARISAVSALATVAAGAAAYRVVSLLGAPRLAFIAPLFFVSSDVVWSRGTRADVHPLALAFATWAFAFALTYRSSRRSRDLAAGSLCVGLGLATHPVVLWTLPAIALLFVGMPRWRARDVGVAFGMVAVGLLPYAYLPLRSAQVTALRLDPTLQLGFTPGMPFWDYAHTANLRNFLWLVSGTQFHDAAGFAAYGTLGRYPEFARSFTGIAASNLGWPLLALAAAGVFALVRRAPRCGIPLLLFGIAGIPFALGYTEEADKARYLLAALWALSGFAALGLAAIAEHIPTRRPAVLEIALLAGACAIVATGTYRHRGVIAVNHDAVARHYLTALRTHTPNNAIVVAAWTYATPAAYGIFVDGSLGNRRIVTAEPATVAQRIARWSATTCVVVVTDASSDALPANLKLHPLVASVPKIIAVHAAHQPDRCLSER